MPHSRAMRGITDRLGLSRGRTDLAILSRVLGVMHETGAGDLRSIDHTPALVGAALNQRAVSVTACA